MYKPPWPANVQNGSRRYYTGNGSWIFTDGWVTRWTNLSYSSVKTPNWRNLSKAERNRIKNSFAQSYAKYSYSASAVTWRGSWANNGHTGFMFSGVLPSPLQGWPVTDARRKALSRVQGLVSRQSVNLAQAFAERKQAVDMLTKSANRVVKLAWDLKRGRFDQARTDIYRWTGILPPNRVRDRRIRGVPGRVQVGEARNNRTDTWANTWLEYQYGWRPLLSDIYGSCELLAKTYHERRPTTVSGSATVQGKLNGVSYWSQDECEAATKWNLSYVDTVRFVIDFVEDDALAEALANTGISNPALLAWELVPYSFVVDWFLPVGNYLEQLTYANGLKFISGTESRRCRIVGNGNHFNPGGQLSYVSNVAVSGKVAYEFGGKTRNKLTAWPYQRFPRFTPKLGVERALNALALVTQVLNGRPPRSRAA